MFGLKIMREVETVKVINKVVCTVEATKASVASDVDINHLQKLAKVTGRPEYCSSLTSKIMTALRENNFIWLVTSQAIVKQFPFSAGVKWPDQTRPVSYGFGFWGRVRYVGDIPDFALRNMAIASECGLDFFTIHSLRPMPVSLEKYDPLLVGWASNPHIVTDNSKRITAVGTTIGVVIAMWGQEGDELSL